MYDCHSDGFAAFPYSIPFRKPFLSTDFSFNFGVSEAGTSRGAPAAAAASAVPAAAPAMADDTPAPSVRAELRRLFSGAISKAFPDASAEVALVPCANPKFGDYQCNNAMAIFGKLKGSPNAPKNPRAVAQAILDALDAPSIDLIDETSCVPVLSLSRSPMFASKDKL